MRIGLSSDFDQILSNMRQNQSRLGTLTTQLASGLRINSAADDPSGLAISESLKTISNGLQQGIANVQTANNALTVAEGGLATITGILQRMRNLVVEANSDLNSKDNLAEIQSEIDQLALEINRISQNANFNGLHLLDGSLAASKPMQPPSLLFINPKVNGNQNTLFDTTTPGVTVASTGPPPPQESEMSFSIDSYDASSNTLQVTISQESPDAGFGTVPATVLHVTPGTNFFVEFGPQPYYGMQNASFQNQFQFNFNTISQSDVGTVGYIVVQAQQNAQGQLAGAQGPLTVNTGTSEGSTISIAIGPTNTQTLGVNEITVGDVLANFASEARIDNAINTVVEQRAEIGAQQVALNEAASDASIQWVNQTASESSIRDLNIGTATTEFTKEQILVQVGTNVLSQSEDTTRQIASLLINALVA
ncbi:MAG TPA: flagellin [Candidatus Aquilonibacter sp.]|nr:flagellin [Candidatus Aquilonibacter sp.]